jgi:hypothetical protein
LKLLVFLSAEARRRLGGQRNSGGGLLISNGNGNIISFLAGATFTNNDTIEASSGNLTIAGAVAGTTTGQLNIDAGSSITLQSTSANVADFNGTNAELVSQYDANQTLELNALVASDSILIEFTHLTQFTSVTFSGSGAAGGLELAHLSVHALAVCRYPCIGMNH